MTIINLNSNISNGGTINITPSQDPGSTVDSAYDLGVLNLDNGGVTVQQAVGYDYYGYDYDSADLYQFTVNEAGEYSFTLNGLGADADLFLLPEDDVVSTTDYPYDPIYGHGYSDWVDYYPGYTDPILGNGLDTSVEFPYDSALSYSTSLGTEAELINIELDPGTYYVGVYSYDQVNTSYSLTLSDNIWTSNTSSNSNIVPAQDPGTDLNSAYNLGVIETNVTVGETVSSSDRSDVYQFTINQDGYYNISLGGLSADADIALLDSFLQPLGVSQNYDSASEFLMSNLDAGTYYVGVSSYDGIETNYELNIAEAIV